MIHKKSFLLQGSKTTLAKEKKKLSPCYITAECFSFYQYMQLIVHYFLFSASHVFQIQRELHRRAGAYLAQTPPELCLRWKLSNCGNPAYEPSTEDQISNGYTDTGAGRVWPKILRLHTAYDNGQRR
jgi:hypothetical protein